MAVEFVEKEEGRILEVTVTGRLHSEDYDRFVPEVERLMEKHGKINLLVEMRDFHGWDAGALWDDLKFDVSHFSDIGRLALVGEKRWEQGMSVFCRPFTLADIRFFEPGQKEEARRWLQAALPVP